MLHNIARINWHQGQVLSDKHFAYLEDSILAIANFSRPQSTNVLYGIIDIKIDQDILKMSGVVKVLELSVIFKNQVTIKLYDNAIFLKDLDLNLSSNQNNDQEINLFLDYEQCSEKRDIGEVVFYKLSLNNSKRSKNDLFILSFIKDSRGLWNINRKKICSLFVLNFNILTEHIISEILKVCDYGKNYLISFQKDNAYSKYCLSLIFKIYNYFTDIQKGFYERPYIFFGYLRDLNDSFNILFSNFDYTINNYNHEDLYNSYIYFCNNIKNLIDSRYVDIFMIDFKDFNVNVGDYDIENNDVYVVVDSKNNGFKIASNDRIDIINKMSLSGVGVERVLSYPFTLDEIGFDVFVLKKDEEFFKIKKNISISANVRENGLRLCIVKWKSSLKKAS